MKRDLLDEHLNQEVTVTLRLADVLRLSEQPGAAPIDDTPRTMPSVPVGASYEGGVFAGITLDGERLAALVLLPGDFKGNWTEAKDWAEKEGGVLPSRHDQLVLFRNVKAEFKESWYWSAEQHASGDECAWSQGFGGGSQGCGTVSGTGRARAVRRIPIR